MFALRHWIPIVLGLCLVPVLGDVAVADPDEVRERWDRMSPDEQQRVRSSYLRWKEMSDEDRDVLRQRHEKFQRLRDKVHDTMDDEDRSRLRRMSPDERRNEMDRNARDFLRRVKDALPRGLRDRLYESMHGIAPWDRSRELSRMIRSEITDRLPRFVRSMVDRGNISASEAQQFQVRLGEAEPDERFRILRRLLLNDPEGFGVPPNLRERWEDCEDPHRAVRMMSEMRPRRMPFDRKLALLAEHGVPEDQIDALRALPEDEADPQVDELFREYGVSPPNRMQRWLLSQGVPKAEIDEVFSGDPRSVKEQLGELMDRHGLDRRGDMDRGRPGRGRGDGDRDGHKGRGDRGDRDRGDRDRGERGDGDGRRGPGRRELNDGELPNGLNRGDRRRDREDREDDASSGPRRAV